MIVWATYDVKVLTLWQLVSREAPAVLALDNKIQRPVHLAIQPLDVPLLVCFTLPLDGSFDRHEIRLWDHLRILTDSRLSILEKAVHDIVLTAQLITDHQLIIPRPAALALEDTELLGHGTFALLDLEVPIEAAGCVGLVVD